MFKTFAKHFLPNPLDRMLKRGGKKILLGWNRGLGDIPLGLFAMVQRIFTFIPDAEITIITRKNLADGFSMLEGVKVITADWKRGEKAQIPETIANAFDLVIEEPNPTAWVSWQLGKLVPKLKWNQEWDALYQKFNLSSEFTYIGMQITAESAHGPWRNWDKWHPLIQKLQECKHIKVLLFGSETKEDCSFDNVIDLRGKTTLPELLSIIKNRCTKLVLPDSGILSILYYIDLSFPIRVVSLWADVQGVLKQNVPSPNPQLVHVPLRGKVRDLSVIQVEQIIQTLFPAAAILLAGGQGSRLGLKGPKGLLPLGGKTLFERFCEKVPKHVPIAIMTSPFNHNETVAYFEKQQCFGREISFFPQEVSPLLDLEKQPLPILGPNGNGSVFFSFLPLHAAFAKKGIEWVVVSNVDNPLADPVDVNLVFSAVKEQSEAAVQCIPRPQEGPPMGAALQEGERVKVIEYTDISPLESYPYAYSGQIAFSFPFFCKMAMQELPLHWVQKHHEGQQVWKGEKFLFDALAYAKRSNLFLVDQYSRYAPIKTLKCVTMAEERVKV